jgi:hypothetical protein
MSSLNEGIIILFKLIFNVKNLADKIFNVRKIMSTFQKVLRKSEKSDKIENIFTTALKMLCKGCKSRAMT